MILVDTSVWVEHFRKGTPPLAAALESGAVAMHPFVVGELACGNLEYRAPVMLLLRELPEVPMAWVIDLDAESFENGATIARSGCHLKP